MDLGAWISVATLALTVLVLIGGLGGRFAAGHATVDNLIKQLDKKADVSDLDAMRERMDRYEREQHSMMAECRKLFDAISAQNEREHRTRSDQHLAILQSISQINVHLGVQMEKLTAVASRVASLERPPGGRRAADQHDHGEHEA